MSSRSTASPPRSHTLITLVVVFAPLLVAWLHKVFIHPRQFYAFYYDPETIYFYDGLRMLRGIAPVNVDNPGTPLQLLSALIALFTHADPLTLDRFRLAGYVVSLGLKIFAALFLLRTLLRHVPPLLQVAALWTFFLAPHALEYDAVWSPETFYFSIGAVMLACFAALAERATIRNALLAGAATGACIGLKLTLLAWLPAVVFIAFFAADQNRLRRVGAAIAGVACGFLIATAPIINRYGETLRHMNEMAARSGSDGRGTAQKVSLSILLDNLARAARYLPAWHIWLAALIILTAIVLFMRGRDATSNKVLAGAAVIAIAGIYLLGSRHIQLRYLIPAGLAAMMLFAAFGDRRLMIWRREIQLLVFGLTAVLLAMALRVDAVRHDQRITNTEALRARVRAVIASRQVAQPVILYSWHYPEPSFGLRSLAYAERFYRRIEERYPRDGHYDPWTRTWHLPGGAKSWDFLVINAADVDQIAPRSVSKVARVGEYFVLQRREDGTLR